MAQTSLIIGDTNWAVKEDSLLGYNVIQNKYLPIPIDCVRATTATRVNEQGLIEVVPRNLLTYSEQFENANWVKSGSGTASAPVVSTNSVISPINIQNAEKITFDLNGGTSSSDLSWLYQNVSTIIGLTYTFSAYVKASAIGDIGKQIRIGGITYSNTITLTSSWQRVSITETAALGTNTSFGFRLRGTEITNDVSMDLWGAQVENFATATEYFPTTNRLDIPRIDYSTGTAALLVEPQRTNLFFYSQELENPYWLKAAIAGAAEPVITANDTISPNGNMDADKVVFSPITILGQSSILYRPFTVTNTSYSQSFYIKGLLGTEVIWIEYTKDGVSFISQICNLTTNWQRFSLSSLLTAGADNVIIGVDTRDTSQTLRPAQTVFIWGAQFEVGSYPTSYIPTVASTVTRNADVISKTGISDLIGQTEGTVFIDFNYNLDLGNQDSYLVYIGQTDNSATNAIYIDYSFGNFRWVVNGGSLTFFVQTTAILGRNKLALSYKSGKHVAYINGTILASNVSINTPPLCSKFGINTIKSAIPLLNNVNSSQLYKTQLTNAECIALTTL